MTPQDKAAPRLDEQIAYIGESIDGECGCFMCRHNRAILASLEELQRIRDEYRYKPKMAPSQARESERQGEAFVDVNVVAQHPNNRLLFKRMCEHFGIALGKDRVGDALKKIVYHHQPHCNASGSTPIFGDMCSCQSLSVSGAEKAEWVPWKPGDALPTDGMYWCAFEAESPPRLRGPWPPKYFELLNIKRYYSIPLPPPYQAIKAEGGK